MSQIDMKTLQTKDAETTKFDWGEVGMVGSIVFIRNGDNESRLFWPNHTDLMVKFIEDGYSKGYGPGPMGCAIGWEWEWTDPDQLVIRGPEARFISASEKPDQYDRAIVAKLSSCEAAELAAEFRDISAKRFGWVVDSDAGRVFFRRDEHYIRMEPDSAESMARFIKRGCGRKRVTIRESEPTWEGEWVFDSCVHGGSVVPSPGASRMLVLRDPHNRGRCTGYVASMKLREARELVKALQVAVHSAA